ncbi:MAG: DEAD/DEAH box helicase [Lachnospiraceae bacterium]|nr:DEAD/DEAH box helicase [Lachnospiraceae bacterium]
MLVKEIGITDVQAEELKKRHIYSAEEFLRKEPLKYYDFSEAEALSTNNKRLMEKIENKIPVAMIGTLTYVQVKFKNKRSIIKLRIQDRVTNNILFAVQMGNYDAYEEYKSMKDSLVLFGGVFTYSTEYACFSCMDIQLLTKDIDENLKIHAIYGDWKRFPNREYKNAVSIGLNHIGRYDYLPEWLLSKYKLMNFKDSARAIHYPSSFSEIENAKKRAVFDNLLYLALKLDRISGDKNEESSVCIFQSIYTDLLESKLPYNLTTEQRNCINEIKDKMIDGIQVNALIEGDVGCGKSIIMFHLMLLMAENGYQSALMAPTSALAIQHYNDLVKLVSEFGYKTALLTADITPKQRGVIIEGIKNGDYSFIVGTNSIISDEVEFKKLGLSIVDEEHKFGVFQRNALFEKGEKGLHQITVSATPMPRSLASAMYGNNTDIYTIKEKPAERKPVRTQIYNNQNGIFMFIKQQLDMGHQAYVVCPAITSSGKTDIATVNETIEMYKEYFTPYGYNIEALTGKTKKAEVGEILSRFKNNETQILVSTTVIEVGVNVPNATVIVLSSAERFGLSTLHQLRGRVGRGDAQSYCILQTKAPDTERLKVLCECNDGFELAMKDLELRGCGDLIGIKQTGNEKSVALMLEYPNMYKKITEIVKDLTSDNTGNDIIVAYETRFPSEVIGRM